MRKHATCVMFRLSPLMSIRLQQIFIFKTSVVAERTHNSYRHQEAPLETILSPYTDLEQTSPHGPLMSPFLWSEESVASSRAPDSMMCLGFWPVLLDGWWCLLLRSET